MAKGYIPDVVLHNILVNGFCKAGHLEKADCLIRDMLDQGLFPNCVASNTFVKGYCLNGNVEEALSLSLLKAGKPY